MSCPDSTMDSTTIEIRSIFFTLYWLDGYDESRDGSVIHIDVCIHWNHSNDICLEYF